MSRNGKIALGVLAIVVVAALIVILWPAGDPLAGVQAVAVEPPDWQSAPQRDVIEDPFTQGLEIAFGNRHITIVPDRRQADAVLVVKEIQVGTIEFSFEQGRLKGRATAVCTLTDVKTGRTHVMDFRLTIDNGNVEARLTPRRFWQAWRG